MSSPRAANSGNDCDEPAVALYIGPSALEVSCAPGRRGSSVFGLDIRLGIVAASRHCRARLGADPRNAAAGPSPPAGDCQTGDRARVRGDTR